MSEAGNVIRPKRCAIRIDTDRGVSGECVGPLVVAARQIDLLAAHLLGAEALAREPLYEAMRFALAQHDGLGVEIDWDYIRSHQTAVQVLGLIYLCTLK